MSSSAFSVFFSYLLIDFVAIFVLLLTGQIIANIFLSSIAKQNSYKSVFVKLFLALALFVFVYAQIKTGFRTGFLLLYPILLFALFHRFRNAGLVLNWREAFDLPFKRIFTEWSRILMVLAIVLIAIAAVLWNNQSGFFMVPHFDFIAYSNLSNELNISGVENYHYQQFLCKGYQPQVTNSLYHYPELWLNALFILLTGKASVITFFFATVPVMVTVVIMGALALYENYAPVNWKVIVVVFLLVNLSGIYLPFYQKWPIMNYWVGLLTPNFISHPKYCFSVMIIIAAVLLLFEELPFYALIMLLAMPIANVGHLPVVLSSGVIGMLLLYITNSKIISRKELAYCLVFYFVFAALFYAYIAHFGNSISNQAASENLITELLHSESKFSLLRTYLSNVAHMLIRGFVLYLPHLLFVGAVLAMDKKARVYFNREQAIVFVFATMAVTTGSFFAFFATSIPDSNQLFYNNLPLLNVAFIIIIIPLVVHFSKIKRLSRMALLSLFILIACSFSFNVLCRFFLEPLSAGYNDYSNEYMAKVREEVNARGGTMGAIWLNSDAYLNMAYSYRMFYRPAPFLCMYNKFHDLVDLGNYSAFSNADNTPLDITYLRNTPFQRYLAAHNPSPDSAALVVLQTAFMKENNISFGFTNNLESIPESIRSRINYSLQDTFAGEYFVEFKRPMEGSVDRRN